MKGEPQMYVPAKMARKYRNATKKEKSAILGSLEEITGFNRSYLMRRLRRYTSGNSNPDPIVAARTNTQREMWKH